MIVCDRCGKPAIRYADVSADLCYSCRGEFDKLFAKWRGGAELVVVEVCTAHGHINVAPCPACTTDEAAKWVSM